MKKIFENLKHEEFKTVQFLKHEESLPEFTADFVRMGCSLPRSTYTRVVLDSERVACGVSDTLPLICVWSGFSQS